MKRAPGIVTAPLGRRDFLPAERRQRQHDDPPARGAKGGADRQTLFITARTGFYAVNMRVKGGGPQ